MNNNYFKLDLRLIVGLLATIIGIISFFPILHRVWKTGYTENFPYLSLFLAILSNLLWILYGTFKKTWANIIAGSIFFLFYTYILFIKIKN